MTSGADWLAKKLGQQPSLPAAPTNLPPTMVQPHVVHPQHPQTYPSAPQPFPQQPAAVPFDTRRTLKEQLDEQHMSAFQAARFWKGGKAMQTEGDSVCPDCGSHLVFSRANASTGIPPRPHCFECGWPIAQGEAIH